MKAQNTKKKSKTKIMIAGGVLLFVLLYVYIYIMPHVSDAFVETYVAEYGTLEAGAETECLLVRNETLYKAQSTGNIERVISQGKLVRKGSKIVTLAGNGYYNETRGVVSYFFDGMENELSEENLDDITYSAMQKTQAEDFAVQKCKKKDLSAGDCIFKIVDNTAWHLCVWLEPQEAEDFVEGSSLTVDFKDGVRLKMKLKTVVKEGDKVKLVLYCNRYYEYFDQYRTKECKLIRSSRSGILIEESSIVEKDGTQGVYVKDKFGAYNFTPISVLTQYDKTAVVEKNYFYDEDGNTVATIKNYDEILRNAEKKAKESEKNVN